MEIYAQSPLQLITIDDSRILYHLHTLESKVFEELHEFPLEKSNVLVSNHAEIADYFETEDYAQFIILDDDFESQPRP